MCLEVASISTTIDCRYANYKIDNPSGMYCVDGLNRVGSESPTEDGRWRHSDLSGNAYEFTLDWYAASYPKPCDDCANLAAATYRTLRGGSFTKTAASVTASEHFGSVPPYRNFNFGMRCARSAP